jgi:hypothetical protein
MTKQIKFEDIKLSYNGKVGCMCGCKGRYSLPTHVDINQAGRERGYAYDPEDVSDRRVKIAVKKINDALIKYEHLVKKDIRYDPGVNICINEMYAQFSDGNRNTVVYFK